MNSKVNNQAYYDKDVESDHEPVLLPNTFGLICNKYVINMICVHRPYDFNTLYVVCAYCCNTLANHGYLLTLALTHKISPED